MRGLWTHPTLQRSTLRLPSLVVAILSAIDRKIDLHCGNSVALEELFKALLHKLMTGEIRVDELNLTGILGARV